MWESRRDARVLDILCRVFGVSQALSRGSRTRGRRDGNKTRGRAFLAREPARDNTRLKAVLAHDGLANLLARADRVSAVQACFSCSQLRSPATRAHAILLAPLALHAVLPATSPISQQKPARLAPLTRSRARPLSLAFSPPAHSLVRLTSASTLAEDLNTSGKVERRSINAASGSVYGQRSRLGTLGRERRSLSWRIIQSTATRRRTSRYACDASVGRRNDTPTEQAEEGRERLRAMQGCVCTVTSDSNGVANRDDGG
ncbi:hypothetical protein BJY59DRAFT_150115 [Rhodotorula toruloides]